MPVFFPFRALRPTKDNVEKFSAKTSDFKNQEEVLADMKSNAESYYYVTKQNLLSTLKKPIEHFFTIGAGFVKQKMDSGDLVRESIPCFYVYRQIDHATGRNYTGIIGLVDVLDLENNFITDNVVNTKYGNAFLFNNQFISVAKKMETYFKKGYTVKNRVRTYKMQFSGKFSKKGNPVYLSIEVVNEVMQEFNEFGSKSYLDWIFENNN